MPDYVTWVGPDRAAARDQYIIFPMSSGLARFGMRVTAEANGLGFHDELMNFCVDMIDSVKGKPNRRPKGWGRGGNEVTSKK